jgi:hypothetical protein
MKPHTEMTTEELRAIVERPRKIRHWGHENIITPLLLDKVMGDGAQLIHFTPIMHRPNFLVARIDSKWTLSNFDEVPDGGMDPSDWCEEMWDAIRDQFYVDGDDEPEDDAPWYEHINSADGCAWGEIELGYFDTNLVEA